MKPMSQGEQRRLLDDFEAVSEKAGELTAALSDIYERAKVMIETLDFHDTAKGFRWEREFMSMATDRGLRVAGPTDSKHDCVVNGLRVQCKRIDKPSGVICTTPVIGRDYLGYQLSDWDVLALKQLGLVLIIPVQAMLLPDGFRILNQIKPGDWRDWLDRWDVFGQSFAFRRETQKVMFERCSLEATDGR